MRRLEVPDRSHPARPAADLLELLVLEALAVKVEVRQHKGQRLRLGLPPERSKGRPQVRQVTTRQRPAQRSLPARRPAPRKPTAHKHQQPPAPHSQQARVLPIRPQERWESNPKAVFQANRLVRSSTMRAVAQLPARRMARSKAAFTSIRRQQEWGWALHPAPAQQERRHIALRKHIKHRAQCRQRCRKRLARRQWDKVLLPARQENRTQAPQSGGTHDLPLCRHRHGRKGAALLRHPPAVTLAGRVA